MRPSIGHLLATVLAIGVAGLLLAACGGDSGSGSDRASATAGGNGAGGTGLVSIRTVDGTDVLADAQGRTLYSANVEKGGKIRCEGGCTSFWDPVTASRAATKAAAADLKLGLATVTRPDGARQLTLDGLPLYTFTQEGPGMLEGDGFADDFNGTHFEWAAAGGGAAPKGNANGTNGTYPY